MDLTTKGTIKRLEAENAKLRSEVDKAKTLDGIRRVCIDSWMKRAKDAELQVRVLREAIKKTLADSESKPGGWGPDVTMQDVLRRALEGAVDKRKDQA